MCHNFLTLSKPPHCVKNFVTHIMTPEIWTLRRSSISEHELTISGQININMNFIFEMVLKVYWLTDKCEFIWRFDCEDLLLFWHFDEARFLEHGVDTSNRFSRRGLDSSRRWRWRIWKNKHHGSEGENLAIFWHIYNEVFFLDRVRLLKTPFHQHC